MFSKNKPKQDLWNALDYSVLDEPIESEPERIPYWKVRIYFKGSKDGSFYYQFSSEHSAQTFMRKVREGTGWYIDPDSLGAFRYEDVSRMVVNRYTREVGDD